MILPQACETAKLQVNDSQGVKQNMFCLYMIFRQLTTLVRCWGQPCQHPLGFMTSKVVAPTFCCDWWVAFGLSKWLVWLVGGFSHMNFIFHHIYIYIYIYMGYIILPIDELHHFQDGLVAPPSSFPLIIDFPLTIDFSVTINFPLTIDFHRFSYVSRWFGGTTNPLVIGMVSGIGLTAGPQGPSPALAT